MRPIVKMRQIAVIGAGMAGLACAQKLAACGLQVVLFDKGRGPGGRMSTRRVSIGGVEVGFDHGAQYFTARDHAFLAEVKVWETKGLVASWPAASEDAWVGTPSMNAPIAAMANTLKVNFSSRVDELKRVGATWQLTGENIGPETYEGIVIAVPAEQVSALLVEPSPDYASAAARTPSQPCWTVMFAFASPVFIDTDVLRPAGDIHWAARNSAKSGRAKRETWVVQASPDWTRRHLQADASAVIASLQKAFEDLVGQGLPEIVFAQAHRWLYAKSGSHGQTYLWDRSIGLGVCGDWLISPRVESAWLSGTELARAMTSQ